MKIEVEETSKLTQTLSVVHSFFLQQKSGPQPVPPMACLPVSALARRHGHGSRAVSVNGNNASDAHLLLKSVATENSVRIAGGSERQAGQASLLFQKLFELLGFDNVHNRLRGGVTNLVVIGGIHQL